jgi:hypothetical protein
MNIHKHKMMRRAKGGEETQTVCARQTVAKSTTNTGKRLCLVASHRVQEQTFHRECIYSTYAYFEQKSGEHRKNVQLTSVMRKLFQDLLGVLQALFVQARIVAFLIQKQIGKKTRKDAISDRTATPHMKNSRPYHNGSERASLFRGKRSHTRHDSQTQSTPNTENPGAAEIIGFYRSFFRFA